MPKQTTRRGLLLLARLSQNTVLWANTFTLITARYEDPLARTPR
jgi:hypothetical protein